MTITNFIDTSNAECGQAMRRDSEFTLHLKKRETKRSSFYSPNGYHMEVDGCYIRLWTPLYMYHDSKLKWPFFGKCILTLLNEHEHITKTIKVQLGLHALLNRFPGDRKCGSN